MNRLEILSEYSYSIRWIFDDLEQHDLNIKTLLKSEQALTDFIYDVAKQLDFQIEIKALVREEGSLVSSLKVLWENSKGKIFETTMAAIITLLITTFFQQFQEPKSTVLDREKFMIELQEKVNKGTLTQEQLAIYLENFSSLDKYRNAFFKANKLDKEVTGIEVKQGSGTIATIPRTDFDRYLSPSVNNEIIIPKAKVYIISPVLVAGTQEKWIGEYEGKKIRFTIKDREFLEKSQTKIISFNTGFFIICDLRRVVKNVDGKEQEIWDVLTVTHNAVDEENIVEFKHARKNNKKYHSGQIDLFDLIDN